MSYIDDILFEEDAKFLSAIEDAKERFRLSLLRRAWTDKQGITHILIPAVVSDPNGKPMIGTWRWACGVKFRLYREHDEGAVPTCFACIGVA